MSSATDDIYVRMRAAIRDGMGVRLGFREVVSLISTYESSGPLMVGGSGSDKITAGIVIEAWSQNIPNDVIMGMLSLLITDTYATFSSSEDKVLLSAQADRWRRAGNYPTHFNAYAVMSWLKQLKSKGITETPWISVPSDVVTALHRSMLNLQQVRNDLSRNQQTAGSES